MSKRKQIYGCTLYYPLRGKGWEDNNNCKLVSKHQVLQRYIIPQRLKIKNLLLNRFLLVSYIGRRLWFGVLFSLTWIQPNKGMAIEKWPIGDSEQRGKNHTPSVYENHHLERCHNISTSKCNHGKCKQHYLHQLFR